MTGLADQRRFQILAFLDSQRRVNALTIYTASLPILREIGACSHGITTAGILEADVNRHMLEISKEVILVADSSKIGVIGLVTLAPLSRVNNLVTDCDAPPGFVETLRNQGMEVILA